MPFVAHTEWKRFYECAKRALLETRRYEAKMLSDSGRRLLPGATFLRAPLPPVSRILERFRTLSSRLAAKHSNPFGKPTSNKLAEEQSHKSEKNRARKRNLNLAPPKTKRNISGKTPQTDPFQSWHRLKQHEKNDENDQRPSHVCILRIQD